MSESRKYPKRLIEVDLPIRKISEHARREKSIRQGHISTMHLWWARRPLAACRAVACASLWFDPADPLCPPAFSEAACLALAKVRGGLRPEDGEGLRNALLGFIADFANWDLAHDQRFVDIARQITKAAYPDGPPVVLDPFAGGGALPIEAARVGATSIASDLNPIPVLLNRVAIEYAPRFGTRLSDLIRSWGTDVGARATEILSALYPRDPDGAIPIAYIWARTINCEGPGCGVAVPLLRTLWLSKKKARPMAIRLVVAKNSVEFELFAPKAEREVEPGPMRLGSVLCPVCNFTTKKDRVRAQLHKRRGGTNDATLVCVVTTRPGTPGRFYRNATARDFEAVRKAGTMLKDVPCAARSLSPVPDEPIPQLKVWKNNPIRVHLYGMTVWGDLFSNRQAFALATFSRLIREVASKPLAGGDDPELRRAAHTCLALALSRLVDRTCSLCTWRPQADQEKVENVFRRQALSMIWDFAEGNPISDGTASWRDAYEAPAKFLETATGSIPPGGTVLWADAAKHPLPDDSVSALLTDPPYYDAVPYADLADFFYVWLRRTLPDHHDLPLERNDTPKDAECVMDEGRDKGKGFFESAMTAALSEGRRIVQPNGIGVIVFAHKSTSGWEAVLDALLKAGWVITASWPLDTEMATRLRARNSAALSSSVHLVCRPREDASGKLREDAVGEWKNVVAELPGRIHEWLPRLALEGVVGADAIFACLGPALEIYSRYARVEKVSGEPVELRVYLEHVWAAVSREALSMVFRDVETEGLEPDARVTAIWLWTMTAPANPTALPSDNDESPDDESTDADSDVPDGYVLEFDTARKIAQGLGARLEELTHVVELKGDKARLLAVHERTKYLFGKTEGVPTPRKAAKKKQMTLFGELQEAAEAQGWGEISAPRAGITTLDRVHQAMLLFGAGRAEALKRFIVEESVGKQPQFWKLAQSLSALYPSGTDEKRWVDGVLARKKGLGF